MAITLNKINRSNVADMVIEQLLNLLLSGKLKLGDRLPPETELAAQVGIGRNSVREAMKVLQVLGIVERRQGDGSYISSNFNLPLDSLLFSLLARIGTSTELVELRRVFEIGVMDLVIDKAVEQDFRDLSASLDRFEQFATAGDIEKTVDADLQFHLSLVEVIRNKALTDLAGLIMRLFRTSMTNHLASPEGLKHAIRGHRETLAALEARDRDQARKAIIESFNVWRQFIPI
jgi:GntR family transcriptional repressor for pyruvate dehydrogenase complex